MPSHDVHPTAPAPPAESERPPAGRDLFSTVKECWAASTGPERAALGLFALTSAQLAFLTPHVVIIPGERAKVFSGLLCAVSAAVTWFAVRRPPHIHRSPEFAVSVVLILLAAVSGLSSLTPFASSMRGFVLMASGVGGFWCARLLLDTTARQTLFAWFCLFLLGGITIVGIAGCLATGQLHEFLDVNPHPLADRVMLLSFAPLTFILWREKTLMTVSIGLLAVAYGSFYFTSLRSAMLIPVCLGLLAVFLGAVRLRYFVAVLIPLVVVMVFFFHQLPQSKMGPQFEPTYYRAENYPFSWHIATKHPLFGIGLRAPRERFLDDYEIKYPYVTKEKFAASVARVVTSENTFLTFMAELGFPFLLIYCGALVILLARLVRLFKNPEPQAGLPPLALLLPILAGLLHFQVLDGLLHPQISWFFHILLGMIPVRTDDVRH
jgi:hypothetical protein